MSIEIDHTEEQALDRLCFLFRKYKDQTWLTVEEMTEYVKLFEFVIFGEEEQKLK